MPIPENIAAVTESVCQAPSTSIHRRSQQLNISETSLRRILHKDLGMTPYKTQLVQELKPIDYCDQLIEDADFWQKKIIFSDEAHFDLGGHVKCKIVAFGAQKTHTLKSQRTQNDPLFGVHFGPEA